jgi:hypothetical protein
MSVVPFPSDKSVLDRPDKTIEKQSKAAQSAYARYSAPGNSQRSATPINKLVTFIQ